MQHVHDKKTLPTYLTKRSHEGLRKTRRRLSHTDGVKKQFDTDAMSSNLRAGGDAESGRIVACGVQSELFSIRVWNFVNFVYIIGHLLWVR